MVDWFLWAVFSLATVFERSRDDIVEAHRSLQRQMIVSSSISFILILFVYLFEPTASSNEKLPSQAIADIYIWVIIGEFTLICVCLTWMTLAFFRYWQITKND